MNPATREKITHGAKGAARKSAKAGCLVCLALIVLLSVLIAVLAAFGVWINSSVETPDLLPGENVQEFTVEVVTEHPHDPQAFTQGLELYEGDLLESTGGYSTSELRRTSIAGQTLQIHELPARQFGEGLTVVEGPQGPQVLQLTWKAGIAHRWDIEGSELVPAGEHSYSGQGWGLCHDEEAGVLWRSDGSATLTAHDPHTFAETGEKVEVQMHGEPVEKLNELECARGQVWANVWKSERIVGIDTDSGAVTALIDASALVARAEEMTKGELSGEQVLNGIAFDEQTQRWYLTGKQWPLLFEVELVPVG